MFVSASEIEKKIVGNLCQLSVQNGAKPGGVFFKEMSNLAGATIKIIIWYKACIYNTFPTQLANLIPFYILLEPKLAQISTYLAKPENQSVLVDVYAKLQLCHLAD